MIRVGLAGYGLAGSIFHAPLIRACARLQLGAVLTSRDAPQRVGSLDALLDASELVVIATPNTTHFPLAKAAIEAGKHVVVDKPFTTSVAEADELIGLAHARGTVLTVFHNRRWDSDFLTVRKVLPKLGDVQLFEAHWDRFRPQIKGGWREEAEPGAGLLADLGPHMIDQALELFGMPDAVSAELLCQRAEAKVDDYFDVTLDFGAARICLRSSTLVAEPRARFAVHGTGGSFVKCGLDPQEAQLKAGADLLDDLFGVDESHGWLTGPDGNRQPAPTERGCYRTFYEGVANAILDGGPAPVQPSDARAGLVIIDLARRSSELGRQRLAVPAASCREA